MSPGTAARSERAARKDEHLELAVRLHGAEGPNAFDDVSFVHHGLPGTAAELVDTGTTVFGTTWEVPFYINAMTGGTRATARVNADLAGAAADAGVAIACGSQHIALREPERADGFRVIRREAPRAFVLANVGPTVTAKQALRAVEMVRADALQVHLNAAQELVMPEGDRDFRDWAGRIASIVEAVGAVGVPVVVKEVGFGLSRRTIEALARVGAAAVDVAGTGGTDFIAIENERPTAPSRSGCRCSPPGACAAPSTSCARSPWAPAPSASRGTSCAPWSIVARTSCGASWACGPITCARS